MARKKAAQKPHELNGHQCPSTGSAAEVVAFWSRVYLNAVDTSSKPWEQSQYWPQKSEWPVLIGYTLRGLVENCQDYIDRLSVLPTEAPQGPFATAQLQLSLAPPYALLAELKAPELELDVATILEEYAYYFHKAHSRAESLGAQNDWDGAHRTMVSGIAEAHSACSPRILALAARCIATWKMKNPGEPMPENSDDRKKFADGALGQNLTDLGMKLKENDALPKSKRLKKRAVARAFFKGDCGEADRHLDLLRKNYYRHYAS